MVYGVLNTTFLKIFTYFLIIYLLQLFTVSLRRRQFFVLLRSRGNKKTNISLLFLFKKWLLNNITIYVYASSFLWWNLLPRFKTAAYSIIMSTSARRRLMRDFRRLQNDPPQGISGSPMDSNILCWQAVIFGPDDTPWEGGTFNLVLEFTEEYPNRPPKVKFVTKMFHPNIYNDGQICLDILQVRRCFPVAARNLWANFWLVFFSFFSEPMESNLRYICYFDEHPIFAEWP